MKPTFTLLILFSLLSLNVQAQDGRSGDTGRSSKANKAYLVTFLKSSPAVRGAMAEAKKYAATKKCTELQINSIDESGMFEVETTCTENYQSGEGDAGIVTIKGQLFAPESDTPELERHIWVEDITIEHG